MGNSFMRVNEVAEALGVSKSYAYKVVQGLNKELGDMGFLTVSGRISKKFFLERMCYGANENKERKG